MKKLILGLLSALALLPGGMLRSGDVRAAETFAVQSPRRDHCANPHANCHGERYEDRRGRYTKDSWSVYYRGRKVEGASVSSFADLGGGYGKDNWTVFYEGRKLEGASAMSFEYKGRGYGKDNWNSYFRGEQLRPGQSPDGMLGGGYAKDSWSVYYRGRKVEGVSASSFEYLGGGYGKDPWKVVYQGREVPGASSSSFEELGWGYARDAWKVYYCGEVIPGASPATFRIPDRRKRAICVIYGAFFAGSPFFAPCRAGIRALFLSLRGKRRSE